MAKSYNEYAQDELALVKVAYLNEMLRSTHPFIFLEDNKWVP